MQPSHHPKRRNRRNSHTWAASLALLPLALSQAHAAQLTAIWGAPASGNFATAANWNINSVPLNSVDNSYVVQIGSGKSVAYNTTGARAIDQFLLDLGSAFSLSSNSLILPTDLTVLGTALIAGSISADHASFAAQAAGTQFLGTRNAVSASNGAVVKIAAGEFSARGFTGGTILNAAGVGSLLDLAGVQTLDSGATVSNFNFTNTVNASDRAVLKLSGVKTLIAPNATAGTLAFNVSAGASLDLSSLQQVTGVTLDSGATTVTADSGAITMGPLQRANRLFVNLQNASTLSLGGATGTSAVSNSTFGVAGGSTLSGALLVATYAARGFTGGTLMSAAGLNSVLDLSGLQTIDSGATVTNFNFTNTVSASDKATVKLGGVKTLVAPSASGGTLAFNVIGGASLDLSGVQQIAGLTQDSGNTSFSADGGSIVLGPTVKANRVSVSLQNASTMTVGGAADLGDITNSTFGVSGGSRLNGAAWLATYAARAFTGGTLLSAAGVNSLLDLSGLQTIDSGATVSNFNFTNTVSASDRAVVNLAGVKTLVAPTNAGGTLAFRATSGGSIVLSSLQSLAGLTIDSGNTSFSADSGSFTLGPLQSANRMSVNLQNGSGMTVGGFAGTGSLTNSTFAVSGGSTLLAAGMLASYSARALNGTLISAAGTGSKLDLSGLQSIDVASGPTNFNYTVTVSASDSGAVNLSGVKTALAPVGGSGTLVFSAAGNGAIDLSALPSINTAGGGLAALNISTGGSIHLGSFSAGPGVRITLSDSGSRLAAAGNLTLLTGSTLAAATGTRLDIGGSFSFQQTVEAQVNTDLATLGFVGSGLQTLEVGGRHLGTLTAAAPVLGNFGIGQLVVGQAATATVLQLVDSVDNGNRSGSEALYLNGGGGSNGLAILGGSTLVLNGLDLYTTEAGQWVHINDLFQNGQTRIAYGDGFITTSAVPEPRTLVLLLAGLGFVTRRVRRQAPQRG